MASSLMRSLSRLRSLGMIQILGKRFKSSGPDLKIESEIACYLDLNVDSPEGLQKNIDDFLPQFRSHLTREGREYVLLDGRTTRLLPVHKPGEALVPLRFMIGDIGSGYIDLLLRPFDVYFVAVRNFYEKTIWTGPLKYHQMGGIEPELERWTYLARLHDAALQVGKANGRDILGKNIQLGRLCHYVIEKLRFSCAADQLKDVLLDVPRLKECVYGLNELEHEWWNTSTMAIGGQTYQADLMMRNQGRSLTSIFEGAR